MGTNNYKILEYDKQKGFYAMVTIKQLQANKQVYIKEIKQTKNVENKAMLNLEIRRITQMIKTKLRG